MLFVPGNNYAVHTLFKVMSAHCDTILVEMLRNTNYLKL